MKEHRKFNNVTGREDTDHLPALPLWFLIIRIFQLTIAIVVLGLIAFAASKFSSVWDGHAMTFFTFVWTFLYMIYLIVSALFSPAIYNIWVNLALEALTTLFWLVTWALLASEAASWNFYSYYDFNYNPLLPNGWKAALVCIKAAAGLGALEWILFCITLIGLGVIAARSRTPRLVPTTATELTTVNTAPIEHHSMQQLTEQPIESAGQHSSQSAV